MTKKIKDVKRYLKFQKKIKFILHNKETQNFLKNHYDHCGKIITLILYYVVQWSNDKKIVKKIRNFKSEWISLFAKFYNDKEIKKIFAKIISYPEIFENNINAFDKIRPFIKILLLFIKNQQIKLIILMNEAYNVIYLSLRYLIYNFAKSQIPNAINEILVDKDYDKKYIITLNNVNFFTDAKNSILDSCGNKVSDLISFLCGCSNKLFK